MSSSNRGIPKRCRCGERSIMRTSETYKNPGRLFYCCPSGSKEDKNHLFKWTDIARVEELGYVQSEVDKMQEDVKMLEKDLHDVETEMGTLTCETRTCEAIANSYGSDIDAIKVSAQGFQKELGELKTVIGRCEEGIEKLNTTVSAMKNMIVCGLVMVLIMYFIFM
ncbi:hypothetical protein EUTSA_v10012038mg [Eutrema salsugineum]|uniref:GRF-type domain-containing protein n=1 Tax=Eutrema salsugineum TaxID=72664 RepID=V4JZ99_EUTSA|nr:hypothetical protein EUTSA_v10012038mg [Eutrema salsugineum]